MGLVEAWAEGDGLDRLDLAQKFVGKTQLLHLSWRRLLLMMTLRIMMVSLQIHQYTRATRSMSWSLYCESFHNSFNTKNPI